MPKSNGSLPALCDTAWRQREQILSRFESAWRDGSRPPIESMLPPEGRADSDLLIELIHLEIEFRFKAGERVDAAHYLQRFPALADSDVRIRELTQAVNRLRGEPAPLQAACDPPARSLSPPQSGQRLRFGKYELQEEAGRGALAAVFRARDTELDRIVAIKRPHPGLCFDAESRTRFEREARSLARLNHPGIVAVYDAILIDGTLAIVSEFISGRTLAAQLEHASVTFREAAELIAAIAVAIRAAHRAGVIHRDLKPANIMLDGDGQPRVTDFGLARLAADEASLTVEGQVLGTPAYMPPEQARGDLQAIDERSDIYSLGAIFYQLLTGVRPFDGPTEAVIARIVDQDPLPPRRIKSTIPADLETICLKAMAKQPQHRYPSADALADDLSRWLQGRPIKARAASSFEHLLRWSRRHPVTAALAMALVLTVITAFSAMGLLLKLSDDRRTQVEAASRTAESNYRIASRSLGAMSDLAISITRNRDTFDTVTADQEQAIRIARAQEMALDRTGPRDLSRTVRLANLDRLLARICKDSGRHEEERTLLREASDLWGSVAQADPQAAAARLQQYQCWFMTDPSDRLSGSGKSLEVWYDRTIALIHQLEGTSHQGDVLPHFTKRRRQDAFLLAVQGQTNLAKRWMNADLELLDSLPAAEAVIPALVLARKTTLAALGDFGDEHEPWPPPQFFGSTDPPTNIVDQYAELAELTVWRAGWLSLDPIWGRQSETDDQPRAQADRFLSVARSQVRAIGLPPSALPRLVYSASGHISVIGATYRHLGRIEEARAQARASRVLADEVVRLHPEQAGSYLVLSEAYMQEAKNAWRGSDRGAIEQALRHSLEAAEHAESLVPGNFAAREMVDIRRRRLAGLAESDLEVPRADRSP